MAAAGWASVHGCVAFCTGALAQASGDRPKDATTDISIIIIISIIICPVAMLAQVLFKFQFSVHARDSSCLGAGGPGAAGPPDLPERRKRRRVAECGVESPTGLFLAVRRPASDAWEV